jgi:acyl carrier protein
MAPKKYKSSAEVESEIRRVTAATLGLDEHKVKLDASFIDDLGATSLDTVELVINFEDSFDFEIPDDAADTILTVGDAVLFSIKNYPGRDDPESDYTSSVLAFRIGENGKIEVGLRGTDGSWLFVDGTKKLPAGIYIVTFNRWGQVLKELEELVNSQRTKEADLQSFFERHPDLLRGDSYDQVIPQAVIQPDDRKTNWKADFVLHPHDQVAFCKIVELKLPSQKLVKAPRAEHNSFYYQLHSAIQQLRDYGAAFSSPKTRERFKDAYGIDVFKPDLQLVVGRKWDISHIDTMHERQRLDSVEIVDWDTTIERLRRKFVE